MTDTPPPDKDSVPTTAENFSLYYNDNNFIGAGYNNQIQDSQRCSIIQGSNNTIIGKYNCHVIGDYIGIGGVTDIQDNSFNIGCYNGVVSYGPIKSRLAYHERIELKNSSRCFIDFSREELLQTGDYQIDYDVRLMQGKSGTSWGTDPDNSIPQLESNLYIRTPGSSTDPANLYVQGDVVAYMSSDRNLKDDIVKLDNCLQNVLDINPVSFNWNNKQSTYVGRDIGLIAQEIQEIYPEIVSKRENGMLAMKYEKLVPVLVGAIQDQQKIIDEMRAELDEIKSKIKS